MPDHLATTSAWRGQDDWRLALDWVRFRLLASGMLREVEVAEVTPKVRPRINQVGRQ